jgi:hypothetical protein
MGQLATGVLIGFLFLGIFTMGIFLGDAFNNSNNTNVSDELLEAIEKQHYELMKKMRIDKYC